METFSALLALCAGIPLTKAGGAELWGFLSFVPEWTPSGSLWRHCNEESEFGSKRSQHWTRILNQNSGHFFKYKVSEPWSSLMFLDKLDWFLLLAADNNLFINSLVPRKFELKFRHVIFKQILVIDGWGISCEIALIWISLDLTDDQPTLLQVMAWCRQATSHYMSQCWSRSLSQYGVTRP